MLLGGLFDQSTFNQSTFLLTRQWLRGLQSQKVLACHIRQGAIGNRGLDLHKPVFSIDVFSSAQFLLDQFLSTFAGL